MKTYTLYKKTHQITGLKYLGYTSTKNVFRYKGSGKYWAAHIKKHGYFVDTEILYQCSNLEEIKLMGLYYSNLWDVVNSKEYANLINESGQGGSNGVVWTQEKRKEVSERNKGQLSNNKGKTYVELYGHERSQEKINQYKKTRSITLANKPKKEKPKRKFPHREERKGLTFDNIYGEERSKEIRQKQSKACRGDKNPRYGQPGTMLGKKHTEEALLKMRKPTGPNKKKRASVICPHCKREFDVSSAGRWHFDNCKFKCN